MYVGLALGLQLASSYPPGLQLVSSYPLGLQLERSYPLFAFAAEVARSKSAHVPSPLICPPAATLRGAPLPSRHRGRACKMWEGAGVPFSNTRLAWSVGFHSLGNQRTVMRLLVAICSAHDRRQNCNKCGSAQRPLPRARQTDMLSDRKR